MRKLRILYLSRNMEAYQGAYYQQDTIDELKRHAQVFLYGPGFNLYNSKDSLADVLAKSFVSFNCIVVGHSWLSEVAGPITPCPEIDLRKAGVPLVAILNKEYNNLENKLGYLANTGFNLIFTHHHNFNHYREKTGIRCIFWPFAYADSRIPENKVSKNIDIAFSGILKNVISGGHHTDGRLRVMHKLFHCVGDLPIRKRRTYSDATILWNAMPRGKSREDKLWGYRALRLMCPKYAYHHLSLYRYFQVLSDSKIVFGTLSPADLVGPRFFETMASGGLVFCEESKRYGDIFPASTYVSYRKNLSDFDEKLRWYLHEDSERKRISEAGKNFVQRGHKWSDRILFMLNEIEGIC